MKRGSVNVYVLKYVVQITHAFFNRIFVFRGALIRGALKEGVD